MTKRNDVLSALILILVLGMIITVIFIKAAEAKAREICKYLGYDGAEIEAASNLYEYNVFCNEKIPLEQIE